MRLCCPWSRPTFSLVRWRKWSPERGGAFSQVSQGMSANWAVHPSLINFLYTMLFLVMAPTVMYTLQTKQAGQTVRAVYGSKYYNIKPSNMSHSECVPPSWRKYCPALSHQEKFSDHLILILNQITVCLGYQHYLLSPDKVAQGSPWKASFQKWAWLPPRIKPG